MKYTIRKGRHQAWPPWPFFPWHKGDINFTFKLPVSNHYPYENHNSYDINKIFGISYGIWHHKFSIRIGWVPIFSSGNKPQFKVYILRYWEGYWESHNLGTLEYDKNYKVEFKKIPEMGNTIRVTVDDRAPYYFNMPESKRFYLGPYFGGNNKAPKKIIVHVNIK